MRVRLLAPHIIEDCALLALVELELPPGVEATPLMEGLDDAAREAIAAVKLRIFARYVDDHLLDDPPIEYPFYNPPVPPLREEVRL